MGTFTTELILGITTGTLLGIIVYLFVKSTKIGNSKSGRSGHTKQTDQETMACSHRKMNSERFLEQLFHEISVETRGRWDENELRHIKKSVSEMMKEIITEAYMDRESCALVDLSKDLIAVGSMENGTKIIAPDEFDFIFVVPMRPIVLMPVEVKKDFDFGAFKLLEGDETCYAARFETEDDILTARSFLEDFFTRICMTTSRLEKERRPVQTPEGFLELIDKDCETIVQKGIATKFRNSFRWTPRFSMSNAIEISVDLVPAIRFKDPKMCALLSQATPFSQNIIEKPTDCLLIPMRYSDAGTRFGVVGSIVGLTPGHQEISNSFFRLSPVEYEIELMRAFRKNTSNHKWFICYIILKYLSDIPGTQNVRKGTPDGRCNIYIDQIQCPIISSEFSSYVWKQIIFRKVCVEKKQFTSIIDCFNDATAVFRRLNLCPEDNVYNVDSMWFPNCNIEMVHFKKPDPKTKSLVLSSTCKNILGMQNVLRKIETDESFNIDTHWRKYHDELQKIVAENKRCLQKLE